MNCAGADGRIGSSAPAADASEAASRALCAVDAPADAVISRLGQLTRRLHDTLRELGYDRELKEASGTFPDARERLQYIATMTEQAAVRVLNATETARPLQEDLATGAGNLSQRWRTLLGGAPSLELYGDLARATCDYLDDVPGKARATNAQLMEIMMAQDFQDLTGQVIKKLGDFAYNLEQELLKLLVDNVPADARVEDTGLLNGPVINNGAGHDNVVTSQAQADELLESLGF